MMTEKKSLDDIFKEGWTEELEFGFGRHTILYKKKDERLIYDELKQEVIIKYYVGGTYKQ